MAVELTTHRSQLSLASLGLLVLIVAASMGGATAGDEMPKGVTWSGSALGGAHYRFGSILAQIVQNRMNIPMTVEGSGGPWQNVALVEDGKSDLIPVPGALGFEAYTGQGKANGRKHEKLRVVMPMFPQFLQWWALPGGVSNYKDLSGKRVDMSGSGSFLNDYGRKLFAMFEVRPSRITNLSNFGDSNSMLVDGLLDAAAAWSGIPAPPAVQMTATRDAHLFGVAKADAIQFSGAYPGVLPGVIPANTYPGQRDPIETLVLWTFVMTREDLAEEFVYLLVKTVFENQSDLVAGFKAATNTMAENIQFAPLPVHKGAARYYHEQGIPVPAAAKPID